MNNFKRLEEEERLAHGEPPKVIKTRLDSTRSIFGLIGNVVELFLPKFLNLFVGMMGGKDEKQSNLGHNRTDVDRKLPKYPNNPTK